MAKSEDEINKTIRVSVWRSGFSDAETLDRQTGSFDHFDVPLQDSQTVLDVVSWVQQELDPTLSYRFACRVGMCGSCAMMVNGKPRWTCRTHINKVVVDGALKIEPLRNLPVVKDLVTDMDPFFDKWVDGKGVFTPTKTRDDGIEAISPNTPQRLAANAAIECINCAVCYAACDVVAHNPHYLGPAALNRAWTLANDCRDGGQIDRLKAISQEGGCHNCHSQQGCTAHCPNELNPTQSIAGLKRLTLKAFIQGKI